MDGLRDTVGMAAFVERAEQVLHEAMSLGARRNAAGRFEQYLAVLREAAGFTYPRPFPWADAPERRRLFFEAAGQVQQLCDAATVWPLVEPDVVRNKLNIILQGAALPPKGDAADTPRNTLFEFVVARALQAKSFNVQMTAADADVVATYAELRPFDVECKRPMHAHSLAKNVTRSRRQLRERCRASGRWGFAVFGIDRLMKLGQSTPNLPTFDELENLVDAILRDQIKQVRAAERGSGKRFFPETPLAGVLLATSIFLADLGGMFTISQMGLFSTGSDLAPVSIEIRQTLGRTIVIN